MLTIFKLLGGMDISPPGFGTPVVVARYFSDISGSNIFKFLTEKNKQYAQCISAISHQNVPALLLAVGNIKMQPVHLLLTHFIFVFFCNH